MKEDSEGDTLRDPRDIENPYSYSQFQSHGRPLSAPPRVSKAFRSSSPPYDMDERPLRPLNLLPQVIEVNGPRSLLALPPLSRPSLPNRSSVSLSGATAVDVDVDTRVISGSDEQGVEAIDIIEDDGDHLIHPSQEITSSQAQTSSSATPLFRPRPPRSLTSTASREVLPIPEEPEDQMSSTTVSSLPKEGESSQPQPWLFTTNAPPPEYPQTPSLIRAFGRIQRAQAEARAQGIRVVPPTTVATSVSPNKAGALFEDEEWETFWKDVRSQAAVAH